jgi:hypothetical protein
MAARPKHRSETGQGATWALVCEMATKLAGVEEGTSYGTPALHVRKKLIARLKEDGETIAIRIDLFDREALIELDPEAFYVTDHYRNYPAMLVRLKTVRRDLLQRLVEDAWRRQAPKALLDAGRASVVAAAGGAKSAQGSKRRDRRQGGR